MAEWTPAVFGAWPAAGSGLIGLDLWAAFSKKGATQVVEHDDAR